MAAFSTEAAAEGLAKSRVASGTYVEAYQGRNKDGTIEIQALMPVTATGGGNWTSVTDDA